MDERHTDISCRNCVCFDTNYTFANFFVRTDGLIVLRQCVRCISPLITFESFNHFAENLVRITRRQGTPNSCSLNYRIVSSSVRDLRRKVEMAVTSVPLDIGPQIIAHY
jgi:hypothetical protein